MGAVAPYRASLVAVNGEPMDTDAWGIAAFAGATVLLLLGMVFKGI